MFHHLGGPCSGDLLSAPASGFLCFTHTGSLSADGGSDGAGLGVGAALAVVKCNEIIFEV